MTRMVDIPKIVESKESRGVQTLWSRGEGLWVGGGGGGSALPVMPEPVKKSTPAPA